MTKQNPAPSFSFASSCATSHARRQLVLAGGGLLASGLAMPALASAAEGEFPAGPVKIIIPFAPGGPTDTVGRLIAMKLQAAWGQAVVIDYKPGAGTAIGADFVAKAPARRSGPTSWPRRHPTGSPSAW